MNKEREKQVTIGTEALRYAKARGWKRPRDQTLGEALNITGMQGGAFSDLVQAARVYARQSDEEWAEEVVRLKTLLGYLRGQVRHEELERIDKILAGEDWP